MSDNQQFCLRWNNHQSTLVQVIDSLLSSGVLVDCTLAAEGQYLHAHKVVLCACSPYLETLLSQHYEKHPIVILKDVKFQELKSMMDYMYKGEVNISQDQLGQFLKAAESLQIKGLTDGGGGENDAKDVGTSAHNKRHDPPPIRKSVPPNQSRSSVVLPSHSAGLTIEPSKRTIPSHLSESQPDSPIRSREGSSSPTPRKRRRPRRPSQGDDDGHQDNCDLPMQQQSILNTVPIIPQLPAGSSSTITKAPPPDDEPDQPAESDVRLAESGLLKEKIEPQSELLIEPKTEYMEETNNDDSVEDLTLDDDDEYDNMDGAGPSHGGDNSNQSYGQWQMGERTHDDVFMAAQEAVGGGPRDSQVLPLEHTASCTHCGKSLCLAEILQDCFSTFYGELAKIDAKVDAIASACMTDPCFGNSANSGFNRFLKMNLPVQTEDKLQELNKNLESVTNRCQFKSVIERLGGRDITSSVSYIMKAVIGNNLVTRISMTGRSNSSAGDLLKFADTNVASTILEVVKKLYDINEDVIKKQMGSWIRTRKDNIKRNRIASAAANAALAASNKNSNMP
ncbi:longitudinals lacking protein, isoforms H/M/V-like isoform X2 [Planococcus citri]|uniref:longitudinals lacking protein, isoforms H/M/V-like isoform X2 n=1 Tax=Planococcus citri TaxID=170843 RepID=UPI0031F81B3E